MTQVSPTRWSQPTFTSVPWAMPGNRLYIGYISKALFGEPPTLCATPDFDLPNLANTSNVWRLRAQRRLNRAS